MGGLPREGSIPQLEEVKSSCYEKGGGQLDEIGAKKGKSDIVFGNYKAERASKKALLISGAGWGAGEEMVCVQ